LIILTLVVGCSTTTTQPTAPSPGTPAPPAPSKADKELVVAIGTGPTTLDPARTGERTNLIILTNIMDRLVEYGPDGGITMLLAKEIRNIDMTTWAIELRPGITFTNGEPVDSAAVKFSLERHNDDKNPSRNTTRPIIGTEIISPTVIHLKLKANDALFLERLTRLYIMPPKYTADNDTTFTDKPVGSGPYMLDEMVKGDFVRLKVNPNYWGTAPQINSVLIRGIPETVTQISELLAGNVHILRAVPPDQVPTINRSTVAKVDQAPGVRSDYLVLDHTGLGGDTPLQDIRVRKAIGHGINVKGIAKDILGGVALNPGMLLGSSHVGHDPNAPIYEYDPVKAKQLLAEAGYPSGMTLKFNTFGGTLVSPRDVAQAIQADLAEIGVKIEINYVEQYAQYSKMIIERKLKDIVTLSAGNSGFAEPDPVVAAFIRSDAPRSYTMDKEIDRLNDLARTLPNVADRAKVYQQIQNRLLSEATILPLWVQPVMFAIANEVDFRAQPDDFLILERAKWR
jgi:peptide/nickel transport system substrate-binding protein